MNRPNFDTPKLCCGYSRAEERVMIQYKNTEVIKSIFCVSTKARKILRFGTTLCKAYPSSTSESDRPSQ